MNLAVVNVASLSPDRMVIDRYNLLHDPSLSSATGKVRFNLVDFFVEDVIFPRFDAPSENGNLCTRLVPIAV
jgi:hypothetical protein